ncbi:pirin domain protein [Shewanella sediminis HAW-EB3]|uniref:Pirin domain protein n=1 Tax=Shewanella sediminis (strain HAW-EB3) TaxID=425104 RepID=A8FZV2_SHESH|nr:pirin family protein [Shewanella sediminis]ABV38375.1 pirin domain protein [Shewanella sediminis HAW-EB3]
MRVINQFSARPAMDGDGVNIRRVADFNNTRFDPFLMLDEIKSDDKQDFIGGFPPHPHRGIETFTYIKKGGFEHRDQLGNVKAIRAKDVQWMSTGSGVIHSEMPLADADEGLHGFQIWVNMPANQKMRPARYEDSSETANPESTNDKGALLRALAGNWAFTGQSSISAPIQDLAGEAAIADLMLSPEAMAELQLDRHEFVGLYLYEGTLIGNNDAQSSDNTLPNDYSAGTYLILDSQDLLKLQAGPDGAGLLLFAGQPIKEKIVHMGPFVMNTQAEIEQTIKDYQEGRFGEIPL